MKKTNNRLIGIFILGAIALIIGAVTLFGSRDLFQKKRHFFAYFEQSVTGLNIGAPIKFRGIEVGQVKTIEGVYDPETSIVTPRLLLEFYPEKLRNARVAKGEYTLFRPLVDRGMRASLKSQSLLTGQLYISLDFYENKPERQLSDGNDRYPEMPTIDSGLGEIFAALEDLPLDALVGQVTNTLKSVENILQNEGIEESAEYLPVLLKDTDAAIIALSTFISGELPNTSKQLRSFLKTGEGSVEVLTTRLTNETLVDAEKTLKELELTLSTARARLDKNDPISYEATRTLREVSNAAASLRRFTDYLEAHPEALVRGRNK